MNLVITNKNSESINDIFNLAVDAAATEEMQATELAVYPGTVASSASPTVLLF